MSEKVPEDEPVVDEPVVDEPEQEAPVEEKPAKEPEPFRVRFTLDPDKDSVGLLNIYSIAGWGWDRRVETGEIGGDKLAALIEEVKSEFSTWLERREKEQKIEELVSAQLVDERTRKMAELEIAKGEKKPEAAQQKS